MSESRNDEQTQATTGNACEMSLEEHIQNAMSALTFFGMGIGCETEYRALLIIAEVAKQLRGHGDFDPLPMATELVTRARAEIERRRKAREKAETEGPVNYIPDNGQVH